LGYNADNLIMIPIERLNLTVRIYNCLKRGRIKTVGELLKAEDEELMKIRGLGIWTLEEIEKLKKQIIQGKVEFKEELINNLETDLKVINKVLDTELTVNMEEVKFYDRVIVDDIDIRNLGLSIKSTNCLLNERIYKVSELVSYDYIEFMKIRNLGALSEKEIVGKLKAVCIFEKVMDKKEFIKENIFKYLKSIDESVDISEVIERLPEGFRDEKITEEMLDCGAIDKDGEKIKVHITTIFEFIDRIKSKKNSEIIKERLKGLKFEEVGDKFGLTRERIRQVCKEYLRNRPKLREDDLKEYFKEYNLTLEQFTKAFGVKDYVYNYLNLVYEAGNKTFEEFITNKEIEEEIRFNGAKTKYLIIDKQHISRNKKSLENYIIKTYLKEEHNADDFLMYYEKLLKDNNLENDERFKLSERYTNTTLLMKKNLIHKQKKMVRFYDIDKYDIGKLISKLKLQKYKNVEISSIKIFKDNEKLMEEYDIRDEYELHNILKKSPEKTININMELKRMPIIQFGKVDRTKQVKDIIKRDKNIKLSELSREYERLYGFKNILSSKGTQKALYEFKKNRDAF